jgi:hypothetical protein
MTSSRWHVFFLFLVLIADRSRNGTFADQPKQDAPRYIARLERAYPDFIRYRTLMLAAITPAAISMESVDDSRSFARITSAHCDREAEPTFPTGSRLRYVLMSLQR